MTNTVSNRKFYIDNLRTFTILLLFPYHIFMIYNNFGESWYIHGADIAVTSLFIDIGWGWMMPLLFAVAGISTAYALKRRNLREYARERINKLLIPLIFGVLLLVPIQSYIAGLYFNDSANYFDFFTKFTDLTGYDGAFTPGQLWFILYLFVISMVCIPFIALHKNYTKKTVTDKIATDKIPLIVLLLLGIMICGFVEAVITRHMFQEFFSWINILALLGLGRHYLNFNNKLTTYLSKSSFGVYIFHQSWIVIVAYFVLQMTNIPALQMLLIFPISILLTFLTYEGMKHICIFQWMFGLKK